MAIANPRETYPSAVIEKPSASATRRRRFAILGEFRYPANLGEIFKCREEGKEKEYLLKKAKVDARGTVDLGNWCQLRHENIASYEDAWQGDDEVMYLLFEPASWCLSVLLDEMKLELPCRKLYPLWLYHIASGLEYMHETNNGRQPVLHRNLNAQSILVSSACVLKLFDFGDAKRLQEKFSTTKTVVGCPEFRSPEIRRGENYRTPTDVWSLGVTAAQVADYRRFKALTNKRTENIIDIVKRSGHREVVGLITRTLQEDPVNRPSAAQFVSELRRLFGEGEFQKLPSSEIYPSPMRECTRAIKPVVRPRPLLNARHEADTTNANAEAAQRGRRTHQSEASVPDPRRSSNSGSVPRRSRQVASSQTQTTDSLLAAEEESGQRVTPTQAHVGERPGTAYRRRSSSSARSRRTSAVICLVPRRAVDRTEQNRGLPADIQVRIRLPRSMGREGVPGIHAVGTLSEVDRDSDYGSYSCGSSGLGDSL